MKRHCKHCNEPIHRLHKLEPAYTIWVQTAKYNNPELGNPVICKTANWHEPKTR